MTLTEWLTTMAIVAILLVTTAIGIMSARASVACKELGWPTSNVTWEMTSWCIKRVDQTDVVRRLDDLRAEAAKK